MELHMEGGPVLAVCPNTAWQKTLTFENLQPGAVNRAESVRECGGGKGINVARVLRNLGFPVTVAGFAGGDTGKLLKEELLQSGAGDLTLSCRNATRCCYTIIDKASGLASELIEPSPEIAQNEVQELLKVLEAHMPEFSAVCLSGTLPPGVTAEFYAQIAAMARQARIPVLLDAFRDVKATLAVGVHMLKINAGELRELSGETDLSNAAQKILSAWPVTWLAVTDGAEAAWLFNATQAWRFVIPALPQIVSPIGAGDCASAILVRRLAERPDPEKMPACFAEALACASASCLTPYPSAFDPADAEKIRPRICINLCF